MHGSPRGGIFGHRAGNCATHRGADLATFFAAPDAGDRPDQNRTRHRAGAVRCQVIADHQTAVRPAEQDRVLGDAFCRENSRDVAGPVRGIVVSGFGSIGVTVAAQIDSDQAVVRSQVREDLLAPPALRGLSQPCSNTSGVPPAEFPVTR